MAVWPKGTFCYWPIIKGVTRSVPLSALHKEGR
jgi:hypothetical protein